MTILLILYIALLGLIFGSFFNVVALRVPAGESLVRPPSHCPHCGRRLGARDLIPVVSYALAGGQCRRCGVRVSALYPLGELLTAVLFVWAYIRFGLTGEALTAVALSALGVIVAVSDLKYLRIPNKVLLFFVPVLALLVLAFPAGPYWQHVLGGLAGGGLVLLFALLGGMGMGDVKLFALLGFVLGPALTLLAFFVAAALGSVAGGLLLLLGVVKRKQPVPFGPWLAAGALIAYGYGTMMIDAYFSLIR